MKKRILIIDDDARNIFALSATLRARSYETVACDNARQALELLKTAEVFDLVLIDMMMPEMDGYETIPLIRKIPERVSIPIIAVTAQAMTGDREKCLRAGADDYLSKPVDVDRLLQLLQTAGV